MVTENKKKKKKHIDEDEDEMFYPAEEQGILPEGTSDEIKEDMDLGEMDEDPLSEEGREKLIEDDEIEPWEAGFAEGASEEGQLAKDALTGEPLMDVDDIIETEIDGKLYRFVNEENARKFKKKKSEEED